MNRYAALYDELSAGLYENMGRFLARNVRFPGKRVLCLASGTGFFPEFYIDHGARHVTSVDISPDFLQLARKRLKDHPRRQAVVFIRDDMAKFETKKRFDLVFINGNSFCYLQTQEEQLECLRRINKYLKPGGRAYIQFVPISSRLNANSKHRRGFLRKKGEKLVEDTFVSVDFDRYRLVFRTVWKTGGRESGDVTRTRIMTVPEFSLLVQLSGFRIGRTWGDYRQRIPAHPWSRICELKK